MALSRRPVQHRLHPQPVRHLAGPLLGHHGPLHVPDPHESPEGVSPDSRRLGVFRRHFLPGDPLVAGGQDRGRPPVQVPLHGQLRLFNFLVYDLVLPAAVRHGVHVLQDLPGGRDTDQVAEAGHEAGHHGFRGDGADAADAPGRGGEARSLPAGGQLQRVRRRVRARRTSERTQQTVVLQDAAQQAAGQELLSQQEAVQVREGEESRQDSGDCDGCVYSVLVAVLRREPAEWDLCEVYLAGGVGVRRRHLARLDQLRDEPSYLRLLEQGLQKVKLYYQAFPNILVCLKNILTTVPIKITKSKQKLFILIVSYTL